MFGLHILPFRLSLFAYAADGGLRAAGAAPASDRRSPPAAEHGGA